VAFSDTTPEAEEIQLQILRSMSEGQRLQLAFEMSLFARDVAKAGIRFDHPDWTDAQITHELLRLAFFPKPLPVKLQCP
jgi:hypothetical protein